MRVLVDADGCPVITICIESSKKYNLECILLCDTAHLLQREGAQTLTFSKGSDSVDFALVNMLQPGDIVVTQDYGLAAMCLARRALPIHQDGQAYTQDNIDYLLDQRHVHKKLRHAGVRFKGQAKRTRQQDLDFTAGLEMLINQAK